MRPLGNIATTGIFWVGVLNILVCLNERAEARLKKEELTPLGDDGEVIPEVNGKKLESLLETEEYLAVFFCKYQYGHNDKRPVQYNYGKIDEQAI